MGSLSNENRIYQHRNPRSTLLPLLQSHLPHSIPLLRRIQHGLTYPSLTAVTLATIPASDAAVVPRKSPESTPWLAAYVDLSRGRETQIYLYSSLERYTTPPSSSSSSSLSGFTPDETFVAGLALSLEQKAHVRAQLLALLDYVKRALLPDYLQICRSASSSEPNEEEEAAAAAVKIAPPPPTAFLIGSMHTGLVALLTPSESYMDPESVAGVKILRRDHPPHAKYLFTKEMFGEKTGRCASPTSDDSRSSSSSCSDMMIIDTSTESLLSLKQPEDPDSNSGLPPNYHFHDPRGRYGVQPLHFDLVARRTVIPRSKESLSRMLGVAVYHYDHNQPSRSPEEEAQPVAWAFIGYDGALATLHVEPEHRGKGLAGELVKETLRCGNDGVFPTCATTDGQICAHADVTITNRASRRVMEKIGARVGWTVTWVIIEV